MEYVATVREQVCLDSTGIRSVMNVINEYNYCPCHP